MPPIICVLIAIIVAVIAWFLGIAYRRESYGSKIGSAGRKIQRNNR